MADERGTAAEKEARLATDIADILSIPTAKSNIITGIERQGCGVDRVFIGVDSDSGVGVLMSTPTPTPTPGPTPACLEWIALCNLQFICIGHSYARHLIVGQVKLQAGPKRDDPTWTRPGPDRVGWLLPPYHNWTLFCDCAWSKEQYLNPRHHGHREPLDQRNNIWTPVITGTESRCTIYGECFCSNSFVKCSNAIAKRANTASWTKWHISDIGTGLGLGPEFRPIAISTRYVEQRRAWFGIYHPASLPQKYAQKWPK